MKNMIIFLGLFSVCLLFPVAVFCSAPDEFEPDNSASASNIIVVNDPLGNQHRTIHEINDEDWIKFYAIADEPYSISLSDVGDGFDPVVELYDTDATTLLYQRDNGIAGEPEVFDFTFVNDGVYYVKVYDYPDAIFGENTGYQLSVFRPHPCLTGTISGTITDSVSDDPISGAYIRSDANDSALSDENGLYRMSVCIASESIGFSKEGYTPYSTSISLDSGELETIDVRLTSAKQLVVQPISQNIGSISGEVIIEVSNGGNVAMEWTASVGSGDDFLHIIDDAQGIDNGTVTVSFDANPADISRTGHVIVTAPNAVGSPASVEFIQDRGTMPDIVVKPASHDFRDRPVEMIKRRTNQKSQRPKRRSPFQQLSHAYVESQIIIKPSPDVGIKSRRMVSIQQELGANVVEDFNTIGAQLWEITEKTVEDAIYQHYNNPDLVYIEPNYKIRMVENHPDDPEFDKQWGLNNIGQTGGAVDADIDAPEAWDIYTGNDEIVAVIDSGVDYNHPDLKNNIWKNPGEIPDNNIDDDQNGYVDDVYGYDFANDDPDPFDDNSHGTHCAGIIAASGNDEIGITGVNWNAKIMALKFITQTGSGDVSHAVKALEYALMMGAKISNNSWGGGGFSDALYEAIQVAKQQDHLFIAAAGNDYGRNIDYDPQYPAAYQISNIISVSATDHYDDLSSFSNIGFTNVDLAAPGSAIYSTIPDNSYAAYNGTSMAAPHVAGVAALVWSMYPSLSASEVKDGILTAVDPLPSLEGKVLSGGRLNAYGALMSFGRFTVRNKGSKPLVVQDISITGADATDFDMNNQTCIGQSLFYGESCSVEIVFLPKSAGKKSAILEVSSNDPDEQVAQIPISGTGTTLFDVYVSASGTGQIKINDILCSEFPRKFSFEYGKIVTLEALPDEDFLNWSGDLDENTNPTTLTIDGDKNIIALFDSSDARRWQATITAQAEGVDGLSHSDWVLLGEPNIKVNRYNIQLGVGVVDELISAPPDPPEYYVKLVAMDTSEQPWKPLGKHIQKEGQNQYQWVIGVNPSGNVYSPEDRISILKWYPNEFHPKGEYRLRKGYDGKGIILVEDMKNTTQYEVAGGDSIQLFTIEFRMDAENSDIKTDMDGSNAVDLKDVIVALRVLSCMNVSADLRWDYVDADIDINGDAQVGLEELINSLQTISDLHEQ